MLSKLGSSRKGKNTSVLTLGEFYLTVPFLVKNYFVLYENSLHDVSLILIEAIST